VLGGSDSDRLINVISLYISSMVRFMDKLGMTGTIYQLINGIVLLVVFFGARIVFGMYMSYQTYLNVMPVIAQIPWHLIVIYSAANVVLNTLNLFWFYKMIESLMKRFVTPKEKRSLQQSPQQNKEKKEVLACDMEEKMQRTQ